MKITVEFLSVPVVTKIVGGKSISFDLSGQTVDDLIDEMINKYGQKLRRFLFDDSGKLDRVFKIFLNKAEWIRRDQMNKTLKDGDQVTLMMLVAGG
jgi:molybdopterin converting factor small subunit